MRPDHARAQAGALLALLVSSAPAAAQAVLQRVRGGAAFDHFGAAVAAAGDVDGDGAADWIVGADAGTEYGPDSGYARVYSGASGALLYELELGGGFDRFGFAVAGLGGDADGDGCDDVLVSAFLADGNGGNSGRVHLLSGRSGAELFHVDGAGATHQLGRSLAAVGDQDGDGVPDFAASSHFVRRVDVFSGASGAILRTLVGPAQAVGFGLGLDLAGDLDGDGIGDLIVGAPDDSSAAFQAGSARVYSGASGALLLELLGTVNHQSIGAAVAGLGDVDGDGVDDVAVGAPEDDTQGFDTGAVRVHSGASGALLFEHFGAHAVDGYGFALDGPGDVDGDGVSDLLVGSPYLDTTDLASGALHLFSGATWELVLAANGPSGSGAGHSVAAVGDTNGDGVTELALGAPLLTEVAFVFEVGRADLIDGSVIPVAPYCVSTVNSSGERARISQLGRTDVGSNDFTLIAGGLPADAPALFLIAPDAAQTPFGDGFLCLGGNVQRLSPATAAGAHGAAWRAVDLLAPAPGVAPIVAGDLRRFQVWFRDPAAGGTGFNTSDGLVAAFGP